jgi:hypothetical protein
MNILITFFIFLSYQLKKAKQPHQGSSAISPLKGYHSNEIRSFPPLFANRVGFVF